MSKNIYEEKADELLTMVSTDRSGDTKRKVAEWLRNFDHRTSVNFIDYTDLESTAMELNEKLGLDPQINVGFNTKRHELVKGIKQASELLMKGDYLSGIARVTIDKINNGGR